jgi:hypothetical protein
LSTFYRVFKDKSHLLDIEYDIYFLWLWENGKRLDLLDDTGDDLDNRITLIQDNMREETIISPEVIYAEGLLEDLEHTDLPVVRGSPSYLVITRRLLELLLAIKPFAYRATPLVIVDVTERGEKFLPSGEVRPGVKTNTNYVLVKLLRHGPLDREKSIYSQKMIGGEEFISGIEPLVLLEPQDGLDPLFRVKERPATLFATEEAREQMEQQGIQGIVYKEGTYLP